MLKFYMDHHIQRAITVGLRRRGIDVLTAFEDGMSEDEDELLLGRASELDRVLFTQDKGFLRITTRWQGEGKEFSGLAFAIQMHVDVGLVIDYLYMIAAINSSEEMQSRVEYVPLK